jgi:hypothetical protein
LGAPLPRNFFIGLTLYSSSNCAAKGSSMGKPVEIENIEEMRRRLGIDDVVLREDIRRLASGDFVKLTFLTRTNPTAGETLRVRITSIHGLAFRGKLADKPARLGRSLLRLGSAVLFTTAHIHSIPKGRPMNDNRLSLAQHNLRGTDSNSLLRMYDQAQQVLHQSPLQREQAKADKTVQRIARELKKRRVTF